MQQHDLVTALQEWMCKCAVSGGGSKCIIAGGCSSVSIWRCETFRDLNCSFMEIACGPSLLLASLGVVSARLAACDVVLQEVSSVTWQQATLNHNSAADAGAISCDEFTQSDHIRNGSCAHQEQSRTQRDTENISLTDDEEDASSFGEFPSSSNLQSEHISFHILNNLPNFSSDACWHKLHSAILLLPTAVRVH